MKTFGLVLLFFSMSCMFVFGQQNEKLDSLLKVLENLPDNEEKVRTFENLFYETIDTESPEVPLSYAKKQLQTAKKVGYNIGIGDALHNHGVYHKVNYSFDSANYYFKEANKIWEEINDDFGSFRANKELGKVEQLTGNFNSAIEYYDKAIETTLKMKRGVNLSEVKREKATVYMDKGSYKLALEEMLEILKILDTLKGDNEIKKADILVGIGRIEYLRENYDSALTPLKEGLAIFKKKESAIWQAITLTELGNTYLDLGEIDRSIESFSESLEICESIDRKPFIAICYSSLGRCYFKKKEYDKAFKYFNQSLVTSRASANNLLITYSDLGQVEMARNNTTKAIINYNKAIKIADSIGSLKDLRDVYGLRALAYQKTGNLEKTVEDQKKYQQFNDSVFNNTKSQQIEELRTIYETEKKEQQIALQDKEITVLEQQAEISTLQKLLLGGLLVLSLIGFYGIRQKLKRNKLEKEKVDAELAFKRKELTTHALHLAKKNEVLEGLKQKAQELKKTEASTKGYQQLIRTINFDLQDDNNWENFSRYFEEVHKDFNRNVKSKYPEVTSNELRLLALLKMNLSSKEIASILNISSEGIKKARYRLRKKLDITTEDSLQDLVLSL